MPSTEPSAAARARACSTYRGIRSSRWSRARHILGHDGYRAGRYDVGGLVRVQAEDRAAAQLGGPLLHGPDAQIAVLDRPREVPLLERRPHRRVLVGRHAAPEDERLGAAADAGAHGAHHHIAAPRTGQRDRPDLPTAGRAQPERVCGSLIVDHRRDDAPQSSRESITGFLWAGTRTRRPWIPAVGGMPASRWTGSRPRTGCRIRRGRPGSRLRTSSAGAELHGARAWARPASRPSQTEPSW